MNYRDIKLTFKLLKISSKKITFPLAYQKVLPLYLHPLLQKGTDSVAQLVEHLPFKERVLGSSPSGITKIQRLRSLFLV